MEYANERRVSRWRIYSLRIRYYFPPLAWLPKYKLSYLKGDLIAGVTVASLLVPQSLSYAQALAKLEPVQGLWTSFVPLLVYAVFGTSKHLSVGPEALISMLVGSAITEYNAGVHSGNASKMNDPAVVATLICMVVGLLLFLMGIFRLGFLDSILSRSLLRGFITAVAAVIMIEQQIPMWGINATLSKNPSSALPPLVPSDPSVPATDDNTSPLGRLIFTVKHLWAVHPLSCLISATSLVYLVGFDFVKRRCSRRPAVQLFPEILMLVVLSTWASWYWSFASKGVLVLKDTESALYSPRIPPIFQRTLKPFIISSGLIATIGFIESLVSARFAAEQSSESVSPNRELVALGLTNMIGSIFGSWPAFASIARTKIMGQSGARSQLAGFFAGLIVLLVILYALPLFHHLPRAALASVILKAASGLVETHDFKFLWQLRAYKDLALVGCPFFATILISVETGILTSIVLSLLMVIRQSTRPPMVLLGRVMVVSPVQGQLLRAKFRPLSEGGVVPIPGCAIVSFTEALYFGNIASIKEKLQRLERFGQLGSHPGDEPPTRIVRRRRAPALNTTKSDDDSESLLSEGEQEPLISWPVLSSGDGRFASSLPDDEVRVVNGPGIQAVVFDFTKVSFIDASATQTLHELFAAYNTRQLPICVCQLHGSVQQTLELSGTLPNIVGYHRVFIKIKQAIGWLLQQHLIDTEEALTYDNVSSVRPVER